MRFRGDIPVEVVGVHASDAMVVEAARVSTLGDESVTPEVVEEHKGLIWFLMKNRHGSPFEHTMFKFKVRAPIFVWREHMRHRAGMSYNEESGRYKQLEPEFYLPAADRPIVQEGKPGAYRFVPGSEDLREAVRESLADACKHAYREYEWMLLTGVAREVARMCLPVNTFSTAFVTCNARSLMHFLSLRTRRSHSLFPSFPQREIEMVAEQYEQAFASAMPLTFEAFNDAGRVCP